MLIRTLLAGYRAGAESLAFAIEMSRQNDGEINWRRKCGRELVDPYLHKPERAA